MSKQKRKMQTGSAPAYRNIFSYILICAVFMLPFTAYLHIDKLAGKSLELFSSDKGLIADWFLYCKELFLLIIAAVTCVFFVGEKIFPDHPYRNSPLTKKNARLPLICIGVYIILAIFSGIFSDNKDIVLWGLHTEYEGVIAIFGYCILFLAGYNYINEKKSLDFYKKAFFVLITVSSLLAVFEYIYSPLMELPFMKYLIAPSQYREMAGSINLANNFRESVLMFYNSNYMGGFCTIIFPVSVYYALSAEGIAKKIMPVLVTFASFAAGIMSNSTAAFYVMLAEALMLIVYFTAKRLFSLKVVLSGMAVCAVAVIIINFVTGNDFVKNIIKSISNQGAYEQETASFTLNEISISDYTVYFSSKDSEYSITLPSAENEVMTVNGLNDTMFGKEQTDANTLKITDLNSGAVIGAVLRQGVLYLDLGYKSTIDFAVTTDGVKAIVQNTALLDEIPSAKFNGTPLSRFYSTATGRGYIWLNTLPVLKECIFIGKGAGNFPFVFVQNDIAGLCNTHGTYRIITDKPHSWYLQIAVTSGIIALLAVLVLFGRFILSGLKKFIGTNGNDILENKDDLFMLCLFTGLCGFMVIGLANDSIITVNPFFWFNFGAAFYYIVSHGKEVNVK